MSGPKSILMSPVDPIALLVAAATIRAASAVAAGYRRGHALRDQHEDIQDRNRDAQAQARRGGEAVLAQRIAELEARVGSLQALASEIGLGDALAGVCPASPAAEQGGQIAHVEALEGLLAELQGIVMTEVGRQQRDLLELPGLDLRALPAAPRPSGPAQRLLARIAHLGPAPQEILALAEELEATLPGERAVLLTTELRGRIQACLERSQQRMIQEAQAVVLGQALADLGYQVEGIDETLFVEGGLVHFRRAGWGEHMVRMRIASGGEGANFNVVRAVDAPGQERSVLDHIAEDRWCAEFPALLKALEAYGLGLTVTRHLGAGELPVQQVARARLPVFREEEAGTGAQRPRAAQLPRPG